jgi:hypothetical protein
MMRYVGIRTPDKDAYKIRLSDLSPGIQKKLKAIRERKHLYYDAFDVYIEENPSLRSSYIYLSRWKYSEWGKPSFCVFAIKY